MTALQVIDRASETSILNAHLQIRTARVQAARMAASDPELARLNTMIDGIAPEPRESQPIIIEGEAIEVTEEPTAVPRTSDPA